MSRMELSQHFIIGEDIVECLNKTAEWIAKTDELLVFRADDIVLGLTETEEWEARIYYSQEVA